MAKVTVLTAVYNAEPYLRQFLDSLKNQTLTDCQFICIDDCRLTHVFNCCRHQSTAASH